MGIAILMSPSLLGPLGSLNQADYLMLAVIFIFSGSLYVLSLTGNGILGVITPIGGDAFIAAWVLVIIAAVKVL